MIGPTVRPRPRQPRSPLPMAAQPLTQIALADVLRTVEPEGLWPLTAVLGLSADGRPLLLRLVGPGSGHIWVLGDDQAGKQGLMRSLVLSLALTTPQRELQIAILDSDRRLRGLDHLPHLLTPPVDEPAAGREVLAFLLTLQQQRLAGSQRPRILVVGDARPEWADLLADLAGAGVGSGVHLVLSLSVPDGAVWRALGQVAGVRLIGPARDPSAWQQAAILKPDGLPADKDRFLAEMGQDRVPFLPARIAQEEAAELALAMWERPAPVVVAEWLAGRSALGQHSQRHIL